jgi:hypothetical protein
MKQKIFILFYLAGIILVWDCGGGGPNTRPPTEVTMAQQMAGNAYEYVRVGMKWINRDGWDYNDGDTERWFSVSYNYYAADWCDDFADKIDSSSTPNQTYWSEYTSYRPGGRNMDDPEAYPWAGTFCQGLVYRSAIKAGYSISSSYLNCIDCWQNLGTEVIIPQEGDLILMDFDTTNPGYEHLGIMWGSFPHILSTVAIYRDPFWFEAGTHTEQEYNVSLPLEFPGQNFYVYDRKYIRLPE